MLRKGFVRYAFGVASLIFLPGCWKKPKYIKNDRTPQSIQRPGHLARAEGKIAPIETRKPLRTLSLDGLERARAYYAQRGDSVKELLFLERMIELAADPAVLKTLRLQAADLYFKNEHFEKASSAYARYIAAYPGAADAPYALYKSALSASQTMLTHDRDPARARAALQLSQTYLKQAQEGAVGYIEFEDEVRKIEQRCVEQVVAYNMHIFDFYRKQGNLVAAQNRLKNMKKELIALSPAVEPKLLMQEIGLCKELGDTAQVAIKEMELANRFPAYTTSTTVVAQKKRNLYANRF